MQRNRMMMMMMAKMITPSPLNVQLKAVVLLVHALHNPAWLLWWWSEYIPSLLINITLCYIHISSLNCQSQLISTSFLLVRLLLRLSLLPLLLLPSLSYTTRNSLWWQGVYISSLFIEHCYSADFYEWINSLNSTNWMLCYQTKVH